METRLGRRIPQLLTAWPFVKVVDRVAPAKLPALRKSDLPALHAAAPPFDRVRFTLYDTNID
jgi:hypothetical protein